MESPRGARGLGLLLVLNSHDGVYGSYLLQANVEREIGRLLALLEVKEAKVQEARDGLGGGALRDTAKNLLGLDSCASFEKSSLKSISF